MTNLTPAQQKLLAEQKIIEGHRTAARDVFNACANEFENIVGQSLDPEDPTAPKVVAKFRKADGSTQTFDVDLTKPLDEIMKDLKAKVAAMGNQLPNISM